MARRPINFTFKGDSAGLNTGVQAGVMGLRRLAGEMKDVDRVADRLDGRNVDLDVKADGLVGVRTRLQAMRAELQRDIEINPDVDIFGALTKLRRLDREISRIDRQRVDVDVDLDIDRNSVGRFISRGAGLGLKFGEAITDAAAKPLEVGLKTIASNPIVGTALAAGIGVAMAGAISKALLASIAPVSAALGGLFAGAVAGAGYQLVKSFAGFEAADRKLKTVFKGMTGTIIDWSEEVSIRAGVGEVELQKMASSVQDLLVPRGFSRRDAAGMTTEIVERGIALAEFSGVEKAQGIEAVTKAMLGENEQLKQLGVQIRKSDVTAWLKDNEKAVRGMTDAQAEVVATLAILEERSKDAWKAYLDGGSDAEVLMDTLNATIANLKTDAIKGFGGIFLDLIGDIGATGEALDNLDLGKWIKQNKGVIKDNMLGIIDLALQGADAFLSFASSVISTSGNIGPFLGNILRWGGGVADKLSFIADTMGIMSALARGNIGEAAEIGLTRAFNKDKYKNEAEALAADIEGAFNIDLSAGLDEIDSIRQGITGTREDLEKVRMGDALVIDIKADIKGKSVAEARTRLKGLTEEELEAIIQVTENGTTKVEKKLNRAAKKERKAIIEAKVDEGARSKTERTMDEIAKPFGKGREAPITPKGRGKAEYERWISDVTKPRWQTVNLEYPNQGPTTDAPGAPNGQGGRSAGGVVVQMNDGRLADYIDFEVDGRRAATERTFNRRYGYV